MALVIPGQPGPGAGASGGATPPTPPSWLGSGGPTGGHNYGFPGGPATHGPTLPSVPGFNTGPYDGPHGGVQEGTPSGGAMFGQVKPTPVHPAIQLIQQGNGTTNGGFGPPYGPPHARNWFGPPGSNSPPAGGQGWPWIPGGPASIPPTVPGLPPLIQALRNAYLGVPPTASQG